MLTNARVAPFVVSALLLTACGAASHDPSEGDATPAVVAGKPGARRPAHILPVKGPKQTGGAGQVQPTSAGYLTYRGGPVISNVKIVTIFWTSAVKFQTEINAFYTAVTDSPYFDWLAEYNTPTQKIGRGQLLATYVDPIQSSTYVQDNEVAAEIKKLIGAGKVPANDADTLYMVYFPPGVTIGMGGSESCSSFCAFHSSDTYKGKNFYYGVMPYLGGGCDGGCGQGTIFQNTCSASSHEMIEAVTDAAVGNGDLAWYDDSQGEIGDICNQDEGVVAGFTVQAEWSNKHGGCITTDPNAPNNGPGGVGAGGGPGAGGSGAGAGPGAGGSGAGPGAGGMGAGPGAGGSGAGPGAGGSGAGPGAGGMGAGPGAGGSGAGAGPGGGGSGGCDTGSSCAHDFCSQGAALDASCDPCAKSLCAADPFCCNQGWDDTCVGEVALYCGQTCY